MTEDPKSWNSDYGHIIVIWETASLIALLPEYKIVKHEVLHSLSVNSLSSFEFGFTNLKLDPLEMMKR